MGLKQTKTGEVADRAAEAQLIREIAQVADPLHQVKVMLAEREHLTLFLITALAAVAGLPPLVQTETTMAAARAATAFLPVLQAALLPEVVVARAEQFSRLPLYLEVLEVVEAAHLTLMELRVPQTLVAVAAVQIQQTIASETTAATAAQA